MKRALVLLACVVATACGSKSPAAPTNPASSAPTNFVIATQQVTMSNNIVGLSWAGSSSSYRVFAGSTAGASDLLTADVTGTSYTWMAPRTAGISYVRVAGLTGGVAGTPAQELPVFRLDMRNAIDAMYFGGGPMSESPTVNPGNASAAIWPDGATINVLVTNEATSVTVDFLRGFLADYAAATSNHITITLGTTATDYHGTSVFTLPQNTVIARVFIVCPTAIACANYGPAPVGPGMSFVNLNAAPTANTPGGSTAISHEVGHSFGLRHIEQSASLRQEFRFLMNPILLSGVLTLSEFEKTAISTARAGGMRAGSRRNEALAAGLVLPFGSSSTFGSMHVLLDDIVRVPSSIR